MTKERNNGIDILRFVCALMVIFIHVADDNLIAEYISNICRIASPIFFMISGYCNYKIEDNKIKKHIKKIIKTTIYINIFYLLYFFIKYAFYKKLYILENKLFNSYSIVEIILLNANPILHRLWFLSAVIYVAIIDRLIIRNMNKKSKIIISIFLLITNLILGSYSKLIFNTIFSNVINRNFIFMGVPFYMIGSLIKENNIKVERLNIYLFLALIMSVIETYLLKKYEIYGNKEMYLSTIVLSILTFIYFVNNDFFDKYKAIGSLGRKTSLQIYEYHNLFEEIYSFVFKNNINSIAIKYVFVSICTVIFSFLLFKIKIHYNLIKEKNVVELKKENDMYIL